MITFKNSELLTVINFLTGLKLKNKASRGRTRLVSKLNDKQNQLMQDRIALADLYKPDGEEAVIDEQLNIADVHLAEFNNEQDELFSETVHIDVSEYQHLVDAFFNELEDYPHEFSDQQAVVYDVLMSELENNMKEGK